MKIKSDDLSFVSNLSDMDDSEYEYSNQNKSDDNAVLINFNESLGDNKNCSEHPFARISLLGNKVIFMFLFYSALIYRSALFHFLQIIESVQPLLPTPHPKIPHSPLPFTLPYPLDAYTGSHRL